MQPVRRFGANSEEAEYPFHRSKFERWNNVGRLLLFLTAQDAHHAPLALKPAGGEEVDGLGVGQALLGEDAGGQDVGRVAFLNRHAALDDDGAGVVLAVAEVDGAAGFIAAVT